MYDLLITDCHVFNHTLSGITILFDHEILVDNGQIQDIQPAGTIASERCRSILKAEGQVAMPGLINTHAHVPMVIFRGLAEDVNLETWFNEYMWPLESNLQEEDVYWGMLLGLVEMIEGGVTSVADHYFFMDQAARAVKKAGTRAALGWAVFGDQGFDGLNRTAEFVGNYQGAAGGRITTWMAPHAPYTCDRAFLTAAAVWAGRLSSGIHIHVSETQAQTAASIAETGFTPIQILEQTGILNRPAILAHCCGVTPEDIALLKDTAAGIAHAPKTYMKLSMGTAPIPALMDAGIPVGLATDGAVSNNTLDIWESMRLMTMLQKHETGSPETLNIAETFGIATHGSARVMNMADRLGQIAPGFLADIILVDLTGAHNRPLHSISANLLYSTRAGDVQTVIVDGKVIMRDRELLTLNKKEIFEQVEHSMERLAQRVPGNRIQTYNP